MKTIPIGDALKDFRAGKMLVVIRDQVEPKEGYLVVAAEKVTPGSLAFMIRHGTGYLGLAVPSERMEALRMPQPSARLGDAPFFVMAGLQDNGKVPLAVEEQAALIRSFADPASWPDDAELPHNVVPLRSTRGGVVARATPIEAGLDLARLGRMQAVAVVCKVTRGEDDDTAPPLTDFVEHHGLATVSIPELILHRRRYANAGLVALPTPVRLPTLYGDFTAKVYEDPLTGVHHMAAVIGEANDGRPALTRMHSECLTGDVFGSLRCDCGPQLEAALRLMSEAGHGVLLYLRQEGRGIGLYNKLRAYALQDGGLDTVEANEQLGFPADLRDYGVASEMLKDLGVSDILLLTNNPEKLGHFEDSGIRVVERVPLVVSASDENRFYLRTKREKMGHLYAQDTYEGSVE